VHYKALVENDYLGQWDLVDADGKPRDAVVKILKVERWAPEVRRKKRMPDGTYKQEPNKRIKITFAGKRKAWLAGPVSQKAIADLYGPDVTSWIGKAITLYPDSNVEMGGKRVGGIRVRPSIPRLAPTVDPLDNPVDEKIREKQDEAFGRPGREPGEEG